MSTSSEDRDLPRTRERPERDRSGQVQGEERTRLRETFGAQLRAERGPVSAERLAAEAGVGVNHVHRLECGMRRPSRTMCHRLGEAMARLYGRDDLAAAAIAERLADAAGTSLADRSRRPHRDRARRAAQARELARDGGPPVALWDSPALLASTVLRQDAAGVRR